MAEQNTEAPAYDEYGVVNHQIEALETKSAQAEAEKAAAEKLQENKVAEAEISKKTNRFSEEEEAAYDEYGVVNHEVEELYEKSHPALSSSSTASATTTAPASTAGGITGFIQHELQVIKEGLISAEHSLEEVGKSIYQHVVQDVPKAIHKLGDLIIAAEEKIDAVEEKIGEKIASNAEHSMHTHAPGHKCPQCGESDPVFLT